MLLQKGDKVKLFHDPTTAFLGTVIGVYYNEDYCRVRWGKMEGGVNYSIKDLVLVDSIDFQDKIKDRLG